MTYFNSAKISSCNPTCRKMHDSYALPCHNRCRLSTPGYLRTDTSNRGYRKYVMLSTDINVQATHPFHRRRWHRKSFGISHDVCNYFNRRLSRASNYILSEMMKKNNDYRELLLPTHLHLHTTPTSTYSICYSKYPATVHALSHCQTRSRFVYVPDTDSRGHDSSGTRSDSSWVNQTVPFAEVT